MQVTMENTAVLDERDRRIAALEAELAVLREIVRTQEQLNATSHEPERAMNMVAERARRLTGACGAAVELVDGGDLFAKTTTGSAVEHLGLRLRLDASLSGHCVHTGETINCEDTELDTRVDRSASRRVGVRSMVVTPLVNAGRCEGVLKVMAAQPQAFKASDLLTVRALASMIATTLRSARDYEANPRAARQDPLTGLLNQTSLDEYLDQAIRSGDWAVRDLVVVMVVLEEVEALSTTWGHEIAEDVLIMVARRLRRCVRPTDLVARLTSGHFVIAADIEHDEHLASLAKRVAASLVDPINLHGQRVSVASRVGFARPAPGDDPISLVARAAAVISSAAAAAAAEDH